MSKILLVDAGLAAGWRRAEPDLDQLDEVIAAARELVDDTVVLADASLKWSLPESQQERFEEYRGTAAVLCVPGGTKGGHHAFLATAARAGRGQGQGRVGAVGPRPRRRPVAHRPAPPPRRPLEHRAPVAVGDRRALTRSSGGP